MVLPSGLDRQMEGCGEGWLQYHVLRIGGVGTMRERSVLPCPAAEPAAGGQKGGDRGGLSLQTVPHGLEKNGLSFVCRIARGNS